MLTDTARRSSHAASFVAWGVAGSLGLFGVLRLPWVEARAVLPLTIAQGNLAELLFGTPAAPVEVTMACSGTDALALCVGAVLAYPVPWRARLAGAAAGTGLILALNTVRIGTLGQAAASPIWFAALHVFIWPALLTLAIAGYVFAWMRVAEQSVPVPSLPRLEAGLPAVWRPSRHFILLAGVLLLAFAAAAPLYLNSAMVLALGGVIAGSAAAILGGIGITAAASANILTTAQGAFIVTQECIATPLIPVYVAAVLAGAKTMRQRAFWVAAALPLFTALGIARLLVVALPAAITPSPLFLVHAFYQLLLGAIVVAVAAAWRHGGSVLLRTAVALALGALFIMTLGPAYSRAVIAIAGAPLDDPQGAVGLLPAFQIGLYVALCVAALTAQWRYVVAGCGVLALSQVAGLTALHALASADLAMPVAGLRAWAVAGPVVIVAAMVSHARTLR